MYIRPTPNESGAYPAPQSNCAPGLVEISEKQVQILIDYNGFVRLEIEGGAVIQATPSADAWEAWKSSAQSADDAGATTQEPSESERLAAVEAAILTLMGGGINV